MLAMVLGRKDPKSVALWVHHGWLKATKGPPGAGRTKMWNITEDDILDLLKRRPWLADLKAMEEHYFRSIVRDEWKRDPWYTPTQVAPRLRLKRPDAVRQYIYKGWLAAEKQPGGSERRGWIIRESAIHAFLKNDPRQAHKSTASRAAKIGSNIRLGIPVKISTIWQIQCPVCGDTVTVAAPAWMLGRQVKDKLIAMFTNGECTHGANCSIQADCSNPFDFNNLALAGSGMGLMK
jgi:hypothetical protein